MSISTRQAVPADAEAMCALLNPIIAEGTTTAHRQPFSVERMVNHYIAPPGAVCCTLALDGDQLVGFQSVEWATPDEGLPQGWASIGSFVGLGQQGRGIGQTMWKTTREAARAAGVATIDATIRADNVPGLRYYTGLGFVTWDEIETTLSDGTASTRIRKRFDL